MDPLIFLKKSLVKNSSQHLRGKKKKETAAKFNWSSDFPALVFRASCSVGKAARDSRDRVPSRTGTVRDGRQAIATDTSRSSLDFGQ